MQGFSFEAIDRSISLVDRLAKVWWIDKSIAQIERDRFTPRGNWSNYFIYLIYITLIFAYLRRRWMRSERSVSWPNDCWVIAPISCNMIGHNNTVDTSRVTSFCKFVTSLISEIIESNNGGDGAEVE